MDPTRIVIVGGGLAGLRTAERLRRGGYDGQLTVLAGEGHPPYDRPPLSKALLAGTDPPALPVLRDATRLAQLDLDYREGTSATAVDPAGRTVTTSTGELLPYDHLVIATGLTPRYLSGWPSLAGVFTLRTYEDCAAIHAAATTGRHATVIGAGVLGSEIAASLRTRGLDVDLVEPLAQPLHRVVGDEVGAMIAGLHAEHGVHLHLGVGVAQLLGAERVNAVTLNDGTEIATDLVVVAIGATPQTAWLQDSGIALADGVVVDEFGAASAPGLWAVGDVAALPDPRDPDRQVRLEHWTAASDVATTVAANILAALAGSQPKAHAEPPYMWSDQYDVKLQCLGLPEADDTFALLTGSLAERDYLGAHAGADGVVHAVSGTGRPAALMRCRTALQDGVTVADLRQLAPWEPPRREA